LASVYPGGIVTGTDGIDHSSQNPFVPPALAVNFSDYIGTWASIGDSNKIAITFKRLLFAGPGTPATIYHQLFPGENIGLASIQSVVTLRPTENGDILEGPFTYQLTNLSGVQVLTGSGNVSFKRVAIEPLAKP
jgi:hypothetical protein